MSLFNPIEVLNYIIEEIVKEIQNYVKNPGKDFTRNRILTAVSLIKFIIEMKGNTLDVELYNSFVGQGVNITASAFIQQRSKLKADIFREILQRFNQSRPVDKKLKGYNVYAIDGSDFPLQPNPDSEYYISNKRQKKNGEICKAVSLLHGNFLYDILNKQFIDCVLTPKKGEGNGERVAALEMIKRNNLKNTIIIMDKGYMSFNMIEHLLRSGAKFIIRADSKFAKKEMKALPDKPCFRRMKLFLSTHQTKENMARHDYHFLNLSMTTWDFEDDYELKFNVYKFKINEDGKDQWEILVTNLTPQEFSIMEMKDLYHMRWDIETAFRALKHTIGAIYFHTYTDEYILQELYANLIKFNLAERIASNTVIQQKERQYAYAVDFKMVSYITMEFFHRTCKKALSTIYNLTEKYVQAVRPGRQDERNLRQLSPIPFIYRVA